LIREITFEQKEDGGWGRGCGREKKNQGTSKPHLSRTLYRQLNISHNRKFGRIFKYKKSAIVSLTPAECKGNTGNAFAHFIKENGYFSLK